MKYVRLALSLAFFVPALGFFGFAAAVDSGRRPWWLGVVVGGILGVFFGLVFGGVKGRWLDFFYPPAPEPQGDDHNQEDSMAKASGNWMGTAALALVFLLGLVAYMHTSRQSLSQPSPRAEDRIPKLKKVVADQEAKSVQAVANYQPKTPARIDDLTTSAEDILRQFPAWSRSGSPLGPRNRRTASCIFGIGTLSRKTITQST
jgi:hypothetical protein